MPTRADQGSLVGAAFAVVLFSAVPAAAQALSSGSELGRIRAPLLVLQPQQQASSAGPEWRPLPADSAAPAVNDSMQRLTVAAPSGFAAPALDAKSRSAFDSVSSAIVDREDPRSLASTMLIEATHASGRHSVIFSGEGNYARAPLGDRSLRAAVQNARVVGRYEFRAAPAWGFVGSMSSQHDHMLGLKLRLNVSPGLAYHVVDTGPTRVWVESGYDLELRDQRRGRRDWQPRPLTGNEIEPPHELDHGHRFRVAAQRQVARRFHVLGSTEVRQSWADLSSWRGEATAGLRFAISPTRAVAAVAVVRSNEIPSSAPFETISALRVDQLL
jgi:hypothetical protein